MMSRNGFKTDTSQERRPQRVRDPGESWRFSERGLAAQCRHDGSEHSDTGGVRPCTESIAL